MVIKMTKSLDPDSMKKESQIGSVVLIDRDVDLVHSSDLTYVIDYTPINATNL